jgi:hypothetical protein
MPHVCDRIHRRVARRADKEMQMYKMTALAASVVLLAALTGCSAGADDTAAPNTAAAAAAPASAPAALATEEPVAAPTGAEWADTTYGAFKPVTKSGKGDSVLMLPADAVAGFVTSTYKGSSNFIVEVLDKTNQSTGDGIANAIGNYSGSAAFGLNSYGEPGTSIKIQAEGTWTLTVSPFSAAKEFPASGHGDGVYLYTGEAEAMILTHKGESNFIVSQYGDETVMSGLVNEIGKYTGTVPVTAGPSIFTVTADGAWASGKG